VGRRAGEAIQETRGILGGVVLRGLLVWMREGGRGGGGGGGGAGGGAGGRGGQERVSERVSE
jgi:hypothetical protein